MKKTESLVQFLFGDSQQDADFEGIIKDFVYIFEEMGQQEKLETKKLPLRSALSRLGISGKLKGDFVGFVLEFDSEADYRHAKGKLFNPDAMEKLAEMGWLATDCGDTAMTGERPNFKFRFIELDVKTKDSPKDLESIVKASVEFAFSPVDKSVKTANSGASGVSVNFGKVNRSGKLKEKSNTKK